MVCVQKPGRKLSQRELVLRKSIWIASRVEIQEQNFDSRWQGRRSHWWLLRGKGNAIKICKIINIRENLGPVNR